MTGAEAGPDIRSFCDRDAVTVARDLIGYRLEYSGVGGVIVETEAYTADDPASHSFRGPNAANAAMFGPPGTSYVYRIYGLHHCLNIVCAGAGAVLLRALEPLSGVDRMQARRGNIPLERLCRGPGNLCSALGIDLRMNGLVLDEPPFLLTPGASKPGNMAAGPRIGITKNADIPWRFGVPGSPYLSRPFASDLGRRRARKTLAP